VFVKDRGKTSFRFISVCPEKVLVQTTEDSINTITHAIAKHLESPKAYVRLVFVNFSLG